MADEISLGWNHYRENSPFKRIKDNFMKKLLIIILTVAILLSTIALVGCKEDENNIYGIIVSKPPDKVNYYAGETLDISGCEILVKTRDRNDYTVKVTPQMVSGFSSALGNHTLTITYTVNQTAFVTTQTITVTTRKAKSATLSIYRDLLPKSSFRIIPYKIALSPPLR